VTNVHGTDGLLTLNAVDFDGDGLVDVVLCTRNGGCLRYDISKTFQVEEKVTLAEATDVRVVQSVAIGDVDGANGLDLVVACHGLAATPTTVAVFLNNGFSEDLTMTTLSDAVGEVVAQAVVLYDFDGDTDLDVVVGDSGDGLDGELLSFVNLGGHGTFANFADSPVTIASAATEAAASGIQTIVVGDLGGSSQSLVTGTSISNDVAWWNADTLAVAGSRSFQANANGKIWDVIVVDGNIVVATDDVVYFENACSPSNATDPSFTPTPTPTQDTPNRSGSKKKSNNNKTSCNSWCVRLALTLGIGGTLAIALLVGTIAALCAVNFPKKESDGQAPVPATEPVVEDDGAATDNTPTSATEESSKKAHEIFIDLLIFGYDLLTGLAFARAYLLISGCVIALINTRVLLSIFAVLNVVVFLATGWGFARNAFLVEPNARNANGKTLQGAEKNGWIFIGGYGHPVLDDRLDWKVNSAAKPGRHGGLYDTVALRIRAAVASGVQLVFLLAYGVVVGLHFPQLRFYEFLLHIITLAVNFFAAFRGFLIIIIRTPAPNQANHRAQAAGAQTDEARVHADEESENEGL